MTSQPAPDIRQRGQPTNKSRPVSPLRQHSKNENNKLGEARYTSSRRRRPDIKMKPNPEFKQCSRVVPCPLHWESANLTANCAPPSTYPSSKQGISYVKVYTEVFSFGIYVAPGSVPVFGADTYMYCTCTSMSFVVSADTAPSA
ncbi:hypothetical protein HCDG_05737 [Histoplasma capsulatum H143]|uniref:Uncharacterized protein n=1 Tax=Ajellomyces capsulatus (strain H143) TaxID=544712 RepID=C6HHQ6_AJECH|nr:hypothetical protein HCDG_05737 [Histoplasma capsulatum H143]